MTRHDHDDDLRDAFSVLRAAVPPPAAYTTIHAARQVPAANRARRQIPRGRLLALTLFAITVAGTAAAAITTTGPFSGLAVTATPDSPAAQNLGPLLNTLDGIRQRSRAHGDLAGIPAQLTTPGGDVRGTTITRDGITVDIAMNTNVVCVAAPHGFAVRSTPIRDANARTSQMGCFPTTVPVASLPSISGHDTTGAWLVALVPDHVTNVRVTADNGGAAVPTVKDNVAVATVAHASRFTAMSWSRSDGTRVEQDLDKLPSTSNGDGDAVLRVDP